MSDRISDLPDPILCQILSSLPTKLAATTTVLSHRWKSLHLQLSILDFNDETFQHFNSFIHFTSTVISSRDITVPVHSLTFKCSNKTSSSHQRLMLNEVLNSVFDRIRVENLRSLEIASNGNLIVQLPRRVLSCKNLQVLKLNNAIMEDSCNSSGLGFESRFDFPLLKILHWNGLKFLTAEFLVKFMSSCPVLEELHAYGSSHVSLAHDSEEKFNPFPNLATATIFDHNVPITLLSEVQSLHLKMNRRWIRCEQLPLFHQLTNIDIIFTYILLKDALKWLLELLGNCPKLQNFKIQDSTDGYGYLIEVVGDYWIDPPTVPQCLSSQLKTFFLGGYKGNENEFQFVRYIMQNSKVLQTMTIKSTLDADIDRKHQMIRELSSTTMTSTAYFL
ncbi:putative FBD-associated F-box protein At3g50710 isoform X2 [Vicia villosa]|uniref:putative FBD-associated F-box protein At3g50710 isoform X2 n=1 Tax=Vicia villosa TaxID=3911 RepID=UPI00273CDEBA|nr:putative FBD-associated F-box protein At3g50710 isoform X2 [Vicia villosa]